MKNKNTIDLKGQTVTFYSYKGGVGRTMALVNIACILAKENKKILLIDCDLEAPGLHQFFNIREDAMGFVDFITCANNWISSEENNNEEGYCRFIAECIEDYITKDVKPKYNETDISVDLMKAGKFDKYYTNKLNDISWLEFYKSAPAFFRTFAYNLEKDYDYIFVDARTGLADTSGICTMLVPQKLVLVFALNNQNINGVVNIASQAIDYRLSSNDYRTLSVFPLPARIENSVNPDLQKWIDNYKNKFESLFKDKYLLDECNLSPYFNRCFIQYYPIHAYGENIPSIYEETASSNFITYNYNNFLTVLKKDIPAWEIVNLEDEIYNEKIAFENFKKSPCLFISCVRDEFGTYGDAIRKDLTGPNLETKIQEDFIAHGGATLEKLDEYIQHCEAVIHIVGDMTGSMINQHSLKHIKDKYNDIAIQIPQLQTVLQGNAPSSYTQFEAYLAIYHKKRLFVLTPTSAALRDTGYIKDAEQATQQKEHLNRLRELGYYDEIHFNTKDDLVKNLFRTQLGNILTKISKARPVNLPYQSIGNAFKGREDIINEIYEIFSGTTDGVTAIALFGLGGIGKTRLAVEYALQHKKDYTALLFVYAGAPELLKTNIANLSDPRILDLPEFTAQDEHIKYAAVMNWLNIYSGWLLILDNVDSIEAAENVVEVFKELQQGHVLITTRIGDWTKQINKVRLDVLSKEAAIAFLLETTDDGRQKTGNDNEMAGKITYELGYLALALEQARAYIVTKELSLAEFYKKWNKSSADLLSWSSERQMGHPVSISVAWQTSFDQLTSGAKSILNRLAWMAPDPIPKNLLEIDVPDTEVINALSAWEELKQYSLTSSSSDKKTFSVHRLVQEVTRNRLDKTLALQTLNEALNWMDTAFAGDPTNVEDWPVMEPLVPHILSLLEHTKEYETGYDFTRLLNGAGLLFYTKAQYSTAEPLLRRALEIDEQSYGSNHPNVAMDLNNLAQLLQVTNRLQEAEPLIRRALEIDEQSFGSNHPNVARDLNNLMRLLHDTNRLQEAEILMRRALEIDEQSFGLNHPRVARDLNNLAQLLKGTNRMQEAEPLIRRALKIDEQSFGSNHPNVAIGLNNLVALLQATNRLQEAEPLMRMALKIDEQSFGSNHPNVARDLNNLAQLLQDTNRLQEAEPLMRRALEIDEQSFGSNHPNVAKRLNNLAQLLQDTNRLQEAEPLMKLSFIILLNSFGKEHPNTQTALTNYIILLQELRKSEDEIKVILADL